MLGPAMDAPVDELTDFPRAGARARCMQRFERDLSAWLESSEGRFAVWLAEVSRPGDAPADGDRS